MIQNLAKRTILITGAGQGIGNELCKQLSEAGVNVVAHVQTNEQSVQLKKECKTVLTIVADLSDWNGTRKNFADVPPLDGLVNNAGVTIVKPFEEFTEKEFDFVFNVNIKAVFNVTQVLLPKLKDGASIVNIASLASSRFLDGHTVYSASKAAVDALSGSLALELGPRKIRVNTVNPTATMTPMGRAVWSDPKKSGPLLNHIPLRRFCELQEVIDGIVYLLSDYSSFVNATNLKLEGGYSVI